MKTIITSLLILLASTGLSYAQNDVQGGQFKNLGNWQVHYIAFPSTAIPSSVANQYQLERADDRVFINISVLKQDKAQAVEIQGSATNLVGQKSVLEFKEIKEGESIYYIAQMRVDNEETYRFEINLTQGNTQETLRFHQKMYHQ